ncbi:MAG TPA: radical SAM protein [Gemmatimonadaceae bacterium]|nr:radical SAM protein [Gemmatimonadaceae bacterium]
MRTMYLINPSPDIPTYYGGEVFAGRGLRPATSIADLTLPTVAALAERHLRVVLCDETFEPVDFNASADYIGITGKVSQRGRMRAIAAEFRRRGRKVVIGGPYASLDPEWVRPHCDILVRGEIEEIADELFADLAAGRAREEYVGGRPDLTNTPVPRWDLYRTERASMGTVQTSRGCPFECEFCDVIQYLGRRQRHKPVASVLAELDVLYQHGFRRVFLCDDNFTAYRARAKELLEALRDWNQRRPAGRVKFYTQVSIDAARDDELLDLCASAGLTYVFVGIETPNEESLREAHKRQNLRLDLTSQVHRFLEHGIAVTAGMIVGFDADDVGIFARQYEFAMSTAVPVFTLGALVAPVATPLHARLAAAGRLVPDVVEVAAMPWSTNIVPAGMSRDELLSGLRWLCNNLYDPAAFGERLLRQMEYLGKPGEPGEQLAAGPLRSLETDTATLLGKLGQLGPAEDDMWRRIRSALRERPVASPHVIPTLVQYLQIRYMYETTGIWHPELAGQPAPVVQRHAMIS